MTSILVVCTGNICRSPMAEGFLRAALQGRLGGGAPRIASAGIAGFEGSAATSEAIEAAAERGVDISGHVARRLTPSMADEADLVLCMASEHRDAIRYEQATAGSKTFTLKELTRLLEAAPDNGDVGARIASAAARRSDADPAPDADVADPLGMPMETYRELARELEDWTRRLVLALYEPSPALTGPDR